MNDIKIKEPAPSANDASSNNNNSISNDNTEMRFCQEAVEIEEGINNE